MTPIADVAARIRANPAPVLITDTCCFLDLFRVARPTKETEERRPSVQELEAANVLLGLLTRSEPAFHHVVPELVPGEFRGNADARVQEPFERWVEAHDKTQQWLAGATAAVGAPAAMAVAIRTLNLPGVFREFAERLLAAATVLARDPPCVLKAVERVIAKRRPSHKKELKDSMNLEQALELCRALTADSPFPHALVFASSNTSDFAQPKSNREEDIRRDVHPDLKTEFDAVDLRYATCFQAAYDQLFRNSSLN